MMIDTFDVNDALLILDSLKIIFLHSQVNTIIKNNLMGIFNICIKNIGRVTSLDYEKVKNNFLIKTRHNDLFAKIISSNLLCAQIENNF
jgi:hypothetical protein